jgi:tyrosyl-tRNA synthetase
MAVADQLRDLTRNAAAVLPAGALEEKLKLGRPLRVKLGIDPTAPDIHLGFAVVLRKLRAFQDAGHQAVLIVGDYTARIGDPSGRSDERPVLAGEVLDANARLFATQAYKIIDPERTEVRFNGEWLGKLSYEKIVELARTVTVARLLERDDFHGRFERHEPISLSELLYPVMQAYDSIAVEADVELGGNDQYWNLLTGRDVMEHYGLEPQVILTMPLLVGTDGKEKMSKSKGNYVGIDDPPEEQFGKLMSIPDDVLGDYWRLCLDEEPPPGGEPMEAKLALARRVVARYHAAAAAERAEAHFTRVVREHRAPDEVPEARLPDDDPIHLPALLVEHFDLGSTSEARRLIQQGGVRLDGETARQLDVPRERLAGTLVQAGKRRFLRFSAA